MKKVFSLLLALMLVFSMAIPAFASGGAITYKGRNSIVLTPATTVYTDSDMFGGFKGVMPGDVRQETVKITNLAVDCDYVEVYFKAVPHDATNHPSRKVVGPDETIAEMNAFLSELHLEVKHGNDVIFSGAANAGSESVFLKRIGRFKGTELDVTLTVPESLGNEFAYVEGEVDWVFLFEEGHYPAGEAPKTGDYIMIAVAVMALSACALVVLTVFKKRKKQ